LVAVRRYGMLVLVLALLAGTAVAFAVSERLKLEKSPITATRVAKVFSPVCDCPQSRATIAFRLRRVDRIRLSLIDDEGNEVRRLIDGRRFGKGKKHFTWNGRDDAGELVPEGRYRPKVELLGAGRTIVMPNPIEVDRTRPAVAVVAVGPRTLSPDGDGRGDRLTVRYRASERAHGLLLVNGQQRVRTRRQRPVWQLEWYGTVEGRPLAPGTYRLAVAVEDLAGNVSRPVPAGVARIRYVELPRRPLLTRPGAPLGLSVSTDSPRVEWTLRRGSSLVGRGSGGPTLRLTAPRRPGRYVLVVRAAGHAARSVVVVRRPS
jgi:hypothetical protein